MTEKEKGLLKGSPLLLLVAGAQVLGHDHLTWLLGGSIWLLTARLYLLPRKLDRFEASTIPSLIGAVYGPIAQGMMGFFYGTYFLLVLVKILQKWVDFSYGTFTPIAGVMILVICWTLIVICAFIRDAAFSKWIVGSLLIFSLSILPLIVHWVRPTLNSDLLFKGGNIRLLSTYMLYSGKIDLSILLMTVLVGHPLLSHVLLERGEKKKMMRTFQLAGVTLFCLSIIFGIVKHYTEDDRAFSPLLKKLLLMHFFSSYLLVAILLLYMSSLHLSVDYMAALSNVTEDKQRRYVMAITLSNVVVLLAYFVPPVYLEQILKWFLPSLAVAQCAFLSINLSLYPGKRMFYFLFFIAPVLYGLLSVLDETFTEAYALGLTVLLCCVMLLGAHYVENNGFLVNKPNWWERQEIEEFALKWRDLKKMVSLGCLFPLRIAEYARNALARQRIEYQSLSLYLFLIMLLGIYLSPIQTTSPHHELALMLFLINICLSVIVLLQAFWPRFLAPYFAFYWHFFLTYYLLVVPVIFYFLSGYDVIALLNLLLAIVLLARIVNPKSFLCANILGGISSFLIMRYFAPDTLEAFFNLVRERYQFAYGYVMAALMGIIFIRKKKRELDETKDKLNALVKKSIAIVSSSLNITQSHASIIRLCMKSMQVTEEPDRIDAKLRVHITMEKEAFDTMHENLDKLIDSTTISRSQLKRVFLPINTLIKEKEFSYYHASHCVQEAIEVFMRDYEVQKKPKLYIDKDFRFKGANQVLVALLVQLMCNAHESSQAKGSISIHIKDRKVYITNDGSSISQADLPHIFNEFFTKNSDHLGLGLFFAKQAMEAFGGKIYFSPTHQKNVTRVVLAFP
ncbi:MAG: ATP-binding protein [Bacteroidota bacterium]